MTSKTAKTYWFREFVARVNTNHTTDEVCQAIFENGDYHLSNMTPAEFRTAARKEDKLLDYDFNAMSVDEMIAMFTL